jgi:hypothetical protein
LSAAGTYVDDGSIRPAGSRGVLVSLGGVQRGMLWLLLAFSSIAFIEPSPYEILFVLTIFVFAVAGIRFAPMLIPLVFLLLLFNIGGIIGLIPFLDEPRSVRFMAVSVYLMLTSIFFAAIMAEDTVKRLVTMRSGMLFAAWIASIAGIVGYFNIFGTAEYFTLYTRAAGTFKDPNVFGPFMVLPTIYLIQRILCREIGALRGLALMSLPLMGIFFSFSRGAWGNLIGGSVLCVTLLFLTSSTAALRQRIAIMTVVGLAMIVTVLLVLLSFAEIRDVFNERASLNQSYDVGETGRFGAQLRSIPMLLDLPNGFGPLRFGALFLQDPHNVYINAFASYGWLGGISYFGLIAVTCLVGWRQVFRRTPWQRHAVVIWSVLFVTIVQGFQIDTDHWRHFYLMLGLIWGMACLPEPDRGR